jgi:hypothetical protein
MSKHWWLPTAWVWMGLVACGGTVKDSPSRSTGPFANTLSAGRPSSSVGSTEKGADPILQHRLVEDQSRALHRFCSAGPPEFFHPCKVVSAPNRENPVRCN